jgi:FkbM family methyltransferase
MNRFKSLIKNAPLTAALRYSKLHRAYEYLREPRLRQEHQAETDFYRSCFQGVQTGPALIFDVGANIGEKTERFRELGMRVCAFEPDPQAFKTLRSRFRNSSEVTLVNSALSDQIGQAVFHQYRPQSAYNTLSNTWKNELENGGNLSSDPEQRRFTASLSVDTLTLDSAIARYGQPFFIKIDVEGHELEVLQGLQNKSWKLLSFEANLPAFLIQTVDAIELIQSRFPAAQFRLTGGHLQFNPPFWMSGPQTCDFLQTQAPPYTEIFVRPTAASS